MDIWSIKGLSVGLRLIVKNNPAHKDFHSVVLIEGYSVTHNCIYGRILHGFTIGTVLTGVPGFGFVCITHRDLNGYLVEVK